MLALSNASPVSRQWLWWQERLLGVYITSYALQWLVAPRQLWYGLCMACILAASASGAGASGPSCRSCCLRFPCPCSEQHGLCRTQQQVVSLPVTWGCW